MSTPNPTVQMTSALYALVPLAHIQDSGSNARRRLDGPAFEELTASVRARGVLQPVLLRPLAGEASAQAARFELVCGHRRVAAARAAGLLDVPAVVRELNDLEALEIQLIENLQREDLHPLEEAEGYRTLHEQHGYAIEDLAARVGKSRAYVYARLKLCALQGAARKAFLAGQLEASVALLVARIPHADLQARAVQELLHGARIEIDLDDQDGIGELGGMPPTDYGGLGQPVPYREAAALIQSRYMLRLAGAPFDPKDKGLGARSALRSAARRGQVAGGRQGARRLSARGRDHRGRPLRRHGHQRVDAPCRAALEGRSQGGPAPRPGDARGEDAGEGGRRRPAPQESRGEEGEGRMSYAADTVMANGHTVGAWIAPQLETMYGTGRMPALLPAAEAGDRRGD